MELFEHPCSPGHVLRLDGPAPDVQLAQVRNERHVPIGSLRAMRRARRFDHGQRRREIVERDLTSLQDEPERASGVPRSGRVDLRAPDVAPPDGDEALALQDPERLPERWTRDLEFTDELILLREHAPVGQRSGDDARSNDVGDHLGHAGLRELTAARPR